MAAQSASESLSSILKSPPSSRPDQESITIVGIVRQGKDKNTVELALDNTGKWASIPMSMVIEATEISQVATQGGVYKIVDIELARPSVDPGIFDLLAFMIDRGDRLMPGRRCACECDGEGSNAGPPPGAKMKKKQSHPKTTKANCFACWLLTMASAPEFCYTFGHCNN